MHYEIVWRTESTNQQSRLCYFFPCVYILHTNTLYAVWWAVLCCAVAFHSLFSFRRAYTHTHCHTVCLRDVVEHTNFLSAKYWLFLFLMVDVYERRTRAHTKPNRTNKNKISQQRKQQRQLQCNHRHTAPFTHPRPQTQSHSHSYSHTLPLLHLCTN